MNSSGDICGRSVCSVFLSFMLDASGNMNIRRTSHVAVYGQRKMAVGCKVMAFWKYRFKVVDFRFT